MLSKISVLCFAGSYTVVFLLELTRLLFRSAVRGAVMVGFALAGLFAHAVFLYHRAVSIQGTPLSSEQDWYLLAAAFVVLIYLFLTYFHPKTPFGLFLLPLVLALIATANYLADSQPYAREPASRVWGGIHGMAILMAVVALLVGFAAGLMYLQQARRLKRKLVPSGGLKLPSLEWLEGLTSRAVVVAVLMLGVGVLSGIELNLINASQHVDRLPWSDPVVLSTLLAFVWLLAFVIFGAFYKPARRGRKVAYLTLVSFFILVLALAVSLLLGTKHGGRDQNKTETEKSAGPGAALPSRPIGLERPICDAAVTRSEDSRGRYWFGEAA